MKIHLILYLITFAISLFIYSQNIMAKTNDLNTNNKQIKKVLNKYTWKKRQLIIFTPDKNNEQYRLFKDVETDFESDLNERKLHTWYLVANEQVILNQQINNDLSAQSFRDYFKVDKDQFTLILIGLDSGEKLRLNTANIDYVFSKIDQMPMRLQEIQNKE